MSRNARQRTQPVATNHRHKLMIEREDFSLSFGRYETAEAAEEVRSRMIKKGTDPDTVRVSRWDV
jgi:hypothetical protein